MKENIIQLNQATKTFGSVKALNCVNMSVKKGSIYGLIGENGAGKSTLLKALAGHIFLTSGEVTLWGKCQEKELENFRKRTGCMIEQPGLFPQMTVEQVLKYYCIQKGIPDNKKIEEMLELTNIVEKRKSKCKTLSLGQKQRLGLAIAMIGEPQLLILDEPINGLDPSGIIEFRTLLQRLNEEKGITILLSSHILPELQKIATIFGFISKGVLIEEITAEELLEKVSDCIEIKVSDIETFTALLVKHFPNEKYTIFPNNVMRIYNYQKEEDYSRLASQNDIYITGMKVIRGTLEDYYIGLKNNGENR